MGKRFVVYGLIGICVEVGWTGANSLLIGNLKLVGYTYLWMFPIYGLAVLLEPVHEWLRPYHWAARGVVWMGLLFGIEYLCGGVLQGILGFCPWDYRKSSILNIDGFVRLDYLPAWFGAGLLFERVHDLVIQTQMALSEKYADALD